MSYEARVMRVIDGDTFETESGERVRIANIDAPERGEPGYERWKRELESLILGKTVIIEKVDDDDYGRIVANVYVNGRLVNPTSSHVRPWW